MNVTEHLLACLIEECAEVSQATSKALRFGLEDAYSDRAKPRIKISQELDDLIAVSEMLFEAGILKRNNSQPEAIAAKKAKVEKYLEYARKAGTLQ